MPRCVNGNHFAEKEGDTNCVACRSITAKINNRNNHHDSRLSPLVLRDQVRLNNTNPDGEELTQWEAHVAKVESAHASVEEVWTFEEHETLLEILREPHQCQRNTCDHYQRLHPSVVQAFSNVRIENLESFERFTEVVVNESSPTQEGERGFRNWSVPLKFYEEFYHTSAEETFTLLTGEQNPHAEWNTETLSKIAVKTFTETKNSHTGRIVLGGERRRVFREKVLLNLIASPKTTQETLTQLGTVLLTKSEETNEGLPYHWDTHGHYWYKNLGPLTHILRNEKTPPHLVMKLINETTRDGKAPTNVVGANTYKLHTHIYEAVKNTPLGWKVLKKENRRLLWRLFKAKVNAVSYDVFRTLTVFTNSDSRDREYEKGFKKRMEKVYVLKYRRDVLKLVARSKKHINA